MTSTGDTIPPAPVTAITGPASLHDQDWGHVCPDGTGGVFVIVDDDRNLFPDLFLQHFLADGSRAPGWPEDGIPICTAEERQSTPWLLADDVGGAFVVWRDDRFGSDQGRAYVSRIAADGTRVPGWLEDGTPAATGMGVTWSAQIARDGTGGVFVAWGDNRATGTEARDLYVQRLTSDGAVAPDWPAEGRPVVAGGNRDRYVWGVVPDGAGGALIVWHENPAGVYLEDDLYATRVEAAGATVAGWPRTISARPDWQKCEGVTSDSLGGVLVVWTDYGDQNAVTPYPVVRAQRLLGDGSVAPGWDPIGTRVSAIEDWHDLSSICPDGSGGAWVGFTWLAGANRSLVQHLTAQGVPAPGWPAEGLLLTDPQYSTARPRVVPDGVGGAIVAYADYRNGGEQTRVQRFLGDGPTAVTVTLVRAEALADRVRLAWQVAGGVLSAGIVERQREGAGEAEWTVLASVAFDGTGRLAYEDHDVTPGAHLGYRLSWREDGIERMSEPAWVTVPAAPELALEGARPNPALAGLTVAFTLPGDAPARLEALDAGGRVVRSREVGALGAGRHVVRLDDGVPLAPGRYWLRLRQGNATRARSAVVIR